VTGGATSQQELCCTGVTKVVYLVVIKLIYFFIIIIPAGFEIVLSLRVTIFFLFVIAPIHLNSVYNLIATTTEGPVLSAIFYDPENLEENKNYKEV
jgi:hypothetical protein